MPKGKTYKAAVFEKAGAADEKQVGDMFDLTNGREQTITAGQTIRVYGLAEGDKYTVQELTRAGKMPAGFTLTKREQAATPWAARATASPARSRNRMPTARWPKPTSWCSQTPTA